MPAAKKGTRPPAALAASSSAGGVPAAARYASGGMEPYTTDTLTPAFSHTLPSVSTRVMPPPPSARVQASCLKGVPSISLIAAQMLFCASRMTFSNLARILHDHLESDRAGGMRGVMMAPLQGWARCAPRGCALSRNRAAHKHGGVPLRVIRVDAWAQQAHRYLVNVIFCPVHGLWKAEREGEKCIKWVFWYSAHGCTTSAVCSEALLRRSVTLMQVNFAHMT